MILNVVLWLAGVVLLVAGIAMIRAPLARYRELQATAANLRRYEGWRGGRRSDEAGRTGADEMTDMLRGRVRMWGAAIATGIVLIVAGFIVR